MIIDLRMPKERAKDPKMSDAQVPMPPLPWKAGRGKAFADRLLDIARSAPDGEVFHFFCTSGVRASFAAKILRSFGFEAFDWGATS